MAAVGAAAAAVTDQYAIAPTLENATKLAKQLYGTNQDLENDIANYVDTHIPDGSWLSLGREASFYRLYQIMGLQSPEIIPVIPEIEFYRTLFNITGFTVNSHPTSHGITRHGLGVTFNSLVNRITIENNSILATPTTFTASKFSNGIVLYYATGGNLYLNCAKLYHGFLMLYIDGVKKYQTYQEKRDASTIAAHREEYTEEMGKIARGSVDFTVDAEFAGSTIGYSVVRTDKDLYVRSNCDRVLTVITVVLIGERNPRWECIIKSTYPFNSRIDNIKNETGLMDGMDYIIPFVFRSNPVLHKHYNDVLSNESKKPNSIIARFYNEFVRGYKTFKDNFVPRGGVHQQYANSATTTLFAIVREYPNQANNVVRGLIRNVIVGTQCHPPPPNVLQVVDVPLKDRRNKNYKDELIDRSHRHRPDAAAKIPMNSPLYYPDPPFTTSSLLSSSEGIRNVKKSSSGHRKQLSKTGHSNQTVTGSSRSIFFINPQHPENSRVMINRLWKQGLATAELKLSVRGNSGINSTIRSVLLNYFQHDANLIGSLMNTRSDDLKKTQLIRSKVNRKSKISNSVKPKQISQDKKKLKTRSSNEGKEENDENLTFPPPTCRVYKKGKRRMNKPSSDSDDSQNDFQTLPYNVNTVK